MGYFNDKKVSIIRTETLNAEANPTTQATQELAKITIDGITYHLLSSNDLNEYKEEVNEMISSLGQLHPAGTDTSTNILAKTNDEGIWIGTDTGHWYYWNVNQYVDGGAYLTANIDCFLNSNLVVSSFSDFETTQTTTASFTDDEISMCAGVKLTIGSEEYIFLRYGKRVASGWTIYDFKYLDEKTGKTYYYSYTPSAGYVWYGILDYYVFESGIVANDFTNDTKTIQFNWGNEILTRQFIYVTVDGKKCIFEKTKTYQAQGNVEVTSFVCEKWLLEIAVVATVKYVFYNNLYLPTQITYNDIYVGENETYTNINNALNSITNNSATNRYRVHIKSGVYDVPSGQNAFGLKNYVYIIGENKATCIVRHLYSNNSYDSGKNGFDLSIYQDEIEEASIENLTIITRGCKAPIHIDSDYNYLVNGGKIIISNCILKDVNTTDNIGIPWERYGFNACGGVNVGLRNGQSVEVINCVSNGLIYAHNTYNNDRTYRQGGNFKVVGCEMMSTIVGELDSGSHDIWEYENNKIKWFIINYNNSGGAVKPQWFIDLKLKGNQIDRMYSVYGYTYNTNQEFKVFNDLFGGKWAFISSDIHQIAYNSGNTTISKATLVEVESYEPINMYGAGVKSLTNNFKMFGYALEDLGVGEIGIIQYSGIIRYLVNGACNIGDKLTFDFNNNYFKLATSSDVINAICMENKTTNTTTNIEIKIVNN